MAVRMKDVAKELSLSVVTVSKVLRGHTDISPATRERVLNTVQSMGYRPNLAARSLVTGRTHMIGVVVPDLKHPFFAEIAGGVGNRIRREGYRMVIATSEEDPNLEIEAIESLLDHRVDGLIVASTLRASHSDTFRRIEEQKVPYVLVDRRIPGLRADFVGVDDEAIGAMATEHLIQRGNRRIAHIRGPEISTGDGRFRGYMSVITRYGLNLPNGYIATVEHPDVNGERGGFQAMQKLLSVDPRPDAVFCNNDLIAAGALRAILDKGLKVPDDVALIGVSNLSNMDLLKVSVTSIDQSTGVIGDRAAKILLKHIKGGPKSHPTRILIPPRIFIRDSTAAAPRTMDQAMPHHISDQNGTPSTA